MKGFSMLVMGIQLMLLGAVMGLVLPSLTDYANKPLLEVAVPLAGMVGVLGSLKLYWLYQTKNH